MSLPDLGTLQSKSRSSCQMSPSQILELYNIKLAPTFKVSWSEFCPNDLSGLLCVFRIEITWISQVNGPRGWAHIYTPSALFSSFQQSAYTLNPSKYHSTPLYEVVSFVLYSLRNLNFSNSGYGLLYVPKHEKETQVQPCRLVFSLKLTLYPLMGTSSD